MKHVAAFLLILSLGLSPVASVAAGNAPEFVGVQVGRLAWLAPNGQVVVPVSVACSAGLQVLEAFMYINQEGSQSQFAGVPVICDNQPHLHLVRVSPFPDNPFQRGPASATAFLLLLNPDTGDTESDEDSTALQIR
jgi:hypothetical protein